MEFGQKDRLSRRNKKDRVKIGDTGYPHSLQFYSVPPTENISLQEFETFAIERLKILKVVETVGIRHVKNSDEYKEALTKELRNLKTQGVMKGILKKNNKGSSSEEDIADRRKDHISHFILRLAYSRSEELRRWFIAQEVDLFRFRFIQEDDKSITEFLELNKLNYEPISSKEKASIMQKLCDAAGNSSGPVDITEYYKVPFTEALDLVKSRRVYLSKGFAYVPHSELVVIILSVFRSHLSHSLAVTARALPQLEEDNRLLPLLSNLSRRYLGQDYTNKKPVDGQSITAGDLDELSKKSFPLCMSNLHKSVKEHHHLKHWGRMQYGLFLKGIGLSLEEAMKFWRAEFTKLIDGDKFEKQYSYNIRHNYGKEGKRADYTPYSCVKIITTNHPGPGDYHGCPFKHTDVDLLRQRLQAMSLKKDGIDEVIENVKSSNYQIACARYFEIKHSQNNGLFNVNHPNQYYEESRKVLQGDVKDTSFSTDVASAKNTSSTMLTNVKKMEVENSNNQLDLTPAEINSFLSDDMDME